MLYVINKQARNKNSNTKHKKHPFSVLFLLPSLILSPLPLLALALSHFKNDDSRRREEKEPDKRERKREAGFNQIEFAVSKLIQPPAFLLPPSPEEGRPEAERSQKEKERTDKEHLLFFSFLLLWWCRCCPVTFKTLKRRGRSPGWSSAAPRGPSIASRGASSRTPRRASPP